MNFEPNIPDRPAERGERVFILLFALAFFGLLAASLFRDYQPVKLGALFVTGFWAVSLALHETGHAIAAACLGWRIQKVSIGFGRPLFQFKMAGVPIDIRAVPVSGFVQTSPRDLQGVRWKHALIYFAGPGIELLTVLALIGLVGWEQMFTRTEAVAIIAAQAFAIALTFSAITNLFPFTMGDGVWNDGMGVIQSFIAHRGHFLGAQAAPWTTEAEEWLEKHQPIEAIRCYDRGLDVLPDNPFLHFFKASALIGPGNAIHRLRASKVSGDTAATDTQPSSSNPAGVVHSGLSGPESSGTTAIPQPGSLDALALAQQALDGLLTDVLEVAPELHVHVLDHLARLHLQRSAWEPDTHEGQTRATAELEKAADYSAQALSRYQHDPTLLTSYGAILLEQYKIHEAIEQLNQAKSLMSQWRIDMGTEPDRCAIYLALAEYRRGNQGKAIEQLKALRHRGVRGFLIDRVEAEVYERT